VAELAAGNVESFVAAADAAIELASVNTDQARCVLAALSDVISQLDTDRLAVHAFAALAHGFAQLGEQRRSEKLLYTCLDMSGPALARLEGLDATELIWEDEEITASGVRLVQAAATSPALWDAAVARGRAFADRAQGGTNIALFQAGLLRAIS